MKNLNKYINVSLPRLCILLIISLFLTSNSFSQKNNWLSWRGSQANGYSPEINWSPKAILNNKSILWKTNVGMGHSSVAIKGNRLYTMGNFEKDSNFFDKIVCLNTENGKKIWSHKYKCSEKEDPGPFATPVLSEGYLFTLSREGHLFCFNANNGKIKWKHNLIQEELTNSKNEFAGSPFIYNNLIILNLNEHGIAFNKITGKLMWNSKISENGLTTPVLYEFQNKVMLAIQHQDGLYMINPNHGNIYWKNADGNIPDPIFINEYMYQFAIKGFKKYKINDKTSELVWSNGDVKFQFQSFVKNKKHVYGFGNKVLQCLSLETGKLKWKERIDDGSLIIANNTLIIIDRKGNLIFAEASSNGYSEIAKTKIFDNPKTDTKGRGYRRISACWTNPVLSNGKIYLRNTYGTLACINVSSN